MSTPEKFDFARVLLMPQCWVTDCDKPIDYPLGRAYGQFRVAFKIEGARVYHTERARALEAGLRRIFPAVVLEPATFADWVEQQAEPASP